MDQNQIQNQNIERLANLGYWEWHPAKNQTSFSGGFQRILNFMGDDITPRSLLSYLRQNCQYREPLELLNYLKNLRQGTFPGIKTFAIPMLDLSTKYFEVNASLIKDNTIDYIAGTVQEVTDRVKYDILKEKEIKFEKKIAEIASRFISGYDFEAALSLTLTELGDLCSADQVDLIKIENDIISNKYEWKGALANHNTFVQVGYSTSENKYFIDLVKEKKLVYYQNIEDFPDRLPLMKTNLKNCGARSILISGIQKDKQTIGALILLRNKTGNKWDFSDIHMLKMTSLIFSNALKQNLMHESLKKSEKRLQFALMAGNLGTYEYNLVDKTRYYDERNAQIFGYNSGTLNRIDNWFLKNIHPDHIVEYTNCIDRCIDGEINYFEIEYRICCKDGNYKWINDWGVVTEVNNNAEPIRIVGVVQDISRRKDAEEALIYAKDKAEENEKLKTAFLANVSHEIRTPMNGINGFAELLYNNMVSDNEKHQYLEIIYKNSNRLLTLMNNIIDISKLDTRQLTVFKKEFSLDQLLKDTHRQLKNILENKQNIKFSTVTELNCESTVIKSDESRLRQVIVNLVDNAFKFTDEGFVELGIKLNTDGHLQFHVKDTGLGIPHDYQKRLYSRFTQSENAIRQNFGGTGLGLPISKGLIELMGGNLWVKSRKGVGTTFYFTLPLQNEKNQN